MVKKPLFFNYIYNYRKSCIKNENISNKIISFKRTDVNEKKKGIRKSFHQSNINMFLQFLKYKCQAKNINLTKIDEKWTTQLNCLTGKLFKDKIELGDRKVQLSDAIIIDRDLNSAINIMDRWFENHFASMNKPLDKSGVIKKYNLFNKTHKSLVCV